MSRIISLTIHAHGNHCLEACPYLYHADRKGCSIFGNVQHERSPACVKAERRAKNSRRK